MRLSDHDIEREIGQTPCLCGDFDTWHPKCYAGKSGEQIKVELAAAMRLARAEVMRRFKAQAGAAIAKALTTGEKP